MPPPLRHPPPSADPRDRRTLDCAATRRLSGFTLFELIVVLALMAMATGLVAPNVLGWSKNAHESSWRTDLRAALRSLTVAAYQQGEPLVVDADGLLARVPSLPSDLSIELVEPLRYSATGIASPGSLRLRRPGSPPEVWEIQALTGEPSIKLRQ